MALLRLIAAASLAACGQAGAQPAVSSGLQTPAGWQALPVLGQAVAAAAKAEGVTVDGAEGWGETSIGCYGVWLKLHGTGVGSEEVIQGLELAKLGLSHVVKPELGDDGTIALTFERAPYRGRLRVRVAAGSITALACFANAREPASCEQPCTTLLGGLP